jgi:hypothetical protein
MNLRELAAADTNTILNDISGAGTPFILFSADGNPFPLVGSYGDIGYLINPSTGMAIQGRTIEAVYSISDLKRQTEIEPGRGWRFVCNDLAGKEINLFVVRYEPDRTMGLARIKLAVDMNE